MGRGISRRGAGGVANRTRNRVNVSGSAARGVDDELPVNGCGPRGVRGPQADRKRDQTWFLMRETIASLGIAPMIVSTTFPSLNSSSVGMLCTP